MTRMRQFGHTGYLRTISSFDVVRCSVGRAIVLKRALTFLSSPWKVCRWNDFFSGVGFRMLV